MPEQSQYKGENLNGSKESYQKSDRIVTAMCGAATFHAEYAEIAVQPAYGS